jgi:mediator of RNA polymerase II transcription subunit 17
MGCAVYSHVVRLTFTSPTTLTIHVLQATLPITDMPQLRRMLRTEVGRCALETLVDVGKKDSPNDDGNWFVDRVEEVGVGLKKGRKM